MNLKNKKIGNINDSTDDIYEKAREYIEDERYLRRFDKIMDGLETEQEIDDFFEDVILDYMNDVIAPDGYGFAIHKYSGEIGFWEFNEETEEFDLPYEGMRYINPDDEVEEEEIEDVMPESEIRMEKEVEPKEGIAEVLDDDGTVLAHTPFRSGPPETDPESLEDGGEKAEVL